MNSTKIKALVFAIGLMLASSVFGQFHFVLEFRNGTLSGGSPGPWTQFSSPSISRAWTNGQMGLTLTPGERQNVEAFLNESKKYQDANQELQYEMKKLIQYFSTENTERENIKEFVPAQFRPTNLPAGASLGKVNTALAPLWDAAGKLDVLNASKALQEANKNISTLNKAEQSYAKAELERLFTYPSGQLKNLPFLETSFVSLNGSMQSASIKPFVNAINDNLSLSAGLREMSQAILSGKNPGTRLKLERQEIRNRRALEALKIEQFKQHYFGKDSTLTNEISHFSKETAQKLQNVETPEEFAELLNEIEDVEFNEKIDGIIRSNPGVNSKLPSNALTDDDKLLEASAEMSLCLSQGRSCELKEVSAPGASSDVIETHKKIKSLYETRQKTEKIKDENLKELSQGLVAYGHETVLNDDESAGYFVDVATQVTDIALDLTPGVGTAKDFYEFVSGRSLLTNEELSTTDRYMRAASVAIDIATVGVGGRLSKAALDRGLAGLKRFAHSPAAETVGHKLRKNWSHIDGYCKNLFAKTAELGISSPIVAKSYSRIHDAVKTLPDNLKIRAIKEGTDPSKVAIVGRKMKGGVNDVAKHFIKNGIEVETFKWSKNAELEMLKLTEKYGGRAPYDVVVETLAFKENKQWAEGLLEKGYNIYDIGDPLGANVFEGFSPFYDIETITIWGDLLK